MSESEGTAGTARPSGESAAGVGNALQELGSLDGLELTQHPAVFEQIHGELRRALAAIDDA